MRILATMFSNHTATRDNGRQCRHVLVLAALLVLPVSSARAQSAIDASGHWEGTVHVPDTAMSFEIDLARTNTGGFTGTLSVPEQNLRGLPLLSVAVDGTSIRFFGRQDQRFEGALSDDGKEIAGEFHVSGYAIPFRMNRTGDARVVAPVRSAPVDKALEGTWNGTMDDDGGLRLVLTISNQPNGATANIVNLDEGGLTIPVATIMQAASRVTMDLKSISGSYTGALNSEGTELVGTYTQGASAAPLTFRRVAAK